jgi:biofilm PGA synthesis N-glycosyltransferase PgaC
MMTPLAEKSKTATARSTRFVIISPVRDEEEHIAATIESVASQTVRPVEWIIVNDGSTDRTGAIVDGYAVKYPWIRPLHRNNRGFRKSGGGVIEAFNEGYKTLQSIGWDFIVKLDGDLSLSPDYFERCFQHFYEEPKLGVGGGEICYQIGDKLKFERGPRFHVRGATKIYRRACWEGIGGLWPAPGWDTIDEVKANMLGWKTYSFDGLPVIHHRETGAADGRIRDLIKHGMACHVSGYHPAFVAASCLRRLREKPYLAASLAIAYGFLKGYFTRVERVNDKPLIRYMRSQQLRRLCGRKSIWQ